MEEQQLWYLDNIDVNGIFCPQKSQTMDHVPKKYKKGEYIYLDMIHGLAFVWTKNAIYIYII